MPTPVTGSAVWTTDLRRRLDELLDEYRASLHDSLDGLTEDEARLRLVPSKTTLLGLLKHVTYVEGVWFDQAISGRPTRRSAFPVHPTVPSLSRMQTPSPPFKKLIAAVVRCRAALWPG
ncbi:MAG: DUF664 domain-containing protein [Ilumatobacteraceae bacterium]